MKRCEIELDGQGLLLLIKLIFLIMMTRLQNILREKECLRPCHHYQKFNFINSRRPWPPNLISHLFHPGLFYFLAATSFTPGVFWLRFSYTDFKLVVHIAGKHVSYANLKSILRISITKPSLLLIKILHGSEVAMNQYCK